MIDIMNNMKLVQLPMTGGCDIWYRQKGYGQDVQVMPRPLQL